MSSFPPFSKRKSPRLLLFSKLNFEPSLIPSTRFPVTYTPVRQVRNIGRGRRFLSGERAKTFFEKRSGCLRDGSNLSGTRAGTIDRGRTLFSKKKIGGENFSLQNLKIEYFLFQKKPFLKIKK